MRFFGSRIAGLLVAAMLAGCASSSGGRAQLVTAAPFQEIGTAYSDIELKLRLLVVPERLDCVDGACRRLSNLDQRVAEIGARLAQAAYVLDGELGGELRQRVPQFEFSVLDKIEAGTASSAGGVVALFRGIEALGLTDDELAFVLAREIAHIVERHHEENIGTSLLVSVLAQIFLPVLHVANGAAALLSGNTVQNAAMASVASLAGSTALKASYRPVQLREADELALRLLGVAGWDCRRITESLEILAARGRESGSEWERELRVSTDRLAALFQGPPFLPTALALGSDSEWRLGYLAGPAVIQPRDSSSPF